MKAKPIQGDRVVQEALEPKAYPARLVQAISLGLQPQMAYEGKEKKPVQKIHLTYEMSDQFMKDEDGKILEDKPRWLGKSMAFYGVGADKSTIYRHYKGLDFTDELDGDWEKMLGQPCQITITKEPRKKGEGFVNYISDVAPPISVAGYVQPELVNDTALFDLDDPDLEVLDKLPSWLQEEIKDNLEYNGSKLQEMLGEDPTPEPEEKEKAGNSEPPAPPAPPAPPEPDVPQ